MKNTIKVYYAKGASRPPIEWQESPIARGDRFLETIKKIFTEKRAIAPSFVDRLERVDYSDYQTSLDGKRRHQYRFAVPYLNENGTTWQFIVESAKDSRGYVYLSPNKNGNRAFFPAVSADVRKKIGDRYGVEIPVDGSFWDWLRNHPEIPIFVTEGGGKALSGLSHGFATIALYGCSCLASPDLSPFLKKRSIYIALDSDQKLSARQAVERSLRKNLGSLSKKAGLVSVLEWDSAFKGLDDLLAARGGASVEAAIAASTDAELWLLEDSVAIASARINSRKISADLELDRLPTIDELNELHKTHRDIFIAAPKGLGKSVLGGEFVAQSDAALLPTPLESLARNLASRFEGVDYRTDCDRVNGRLVGADGYVRRIAFCVESIRSISEHIESAISAGAAVFNDELDLQLNSLATSSTHAQKGQRRINERIYWEAQIRGKRTLSVSADLTQYEADLWERKTGRKPFVIRVTTPKKNTSSTVFFDYGKTKKALDFSILAGDRIMVCCSRKSEAKFLQWAYRDYGAIAIHRDNASDPKLRDFFERPDQWLEENKPKILIVSPVLRSGFSITYPAFDKVFCFYHADSINATTALQLSERYRLPVPRFIYLDKSSHKFGSITAEALAIASRLRAKISTYGAAFELQDPYLHYQSSDNWSRAYFRADFVAHLREESAAVKICSVRSTEAEMQPLRLLAKEFAAWERELLCAARNLTSEEAERLKDRRDLSEDDLLALQKFRLGDWSDRLPETVTIEQIERDRKGKKRKELERLERQGYPSLARAADQKSVDVQNQWGAGLSPQDIKHYSLTQRALETLGVHDFLDFALAGGSWEEETAIASELAARLRSNRNSFVDGKRVDSLAVAGINLYCAKDASNNSYIGALLRWFGLQTNRRQLTNENGQRVSCYCLCQSDLAITQEELTRRFQRAIAEGYELIGCHGFTSFLHSHSLADTKAKSETEPAPEICQFQEGDNVIFKGIKYMILAIKNAIAKIVDLNSDQDPIDVGWQSLKFA